MFIHLRTHSHFSFLEGVPSPGELVRLAAGMDMPALALTDQHGLTGAITLTHACRDAGIRPIYGVDLVVRHPHGPGRLVFLAKDLSGWGSLCRLSTAAQTRPDRDPTRGIAFDLLHEHAAGLVCLAGGKSGTAAALLAQGRPEQARTFLTQLKAVFPNDLYVELNIHRPADRAPAAALAGLAASLNLPTAATNDVHFAAPAEHRTHRLLTAIRTSQRLRDLREEALAPPEAVFASPAEMAARFRDYPAALAATIEIAEACRVELPLGIPHYPALDLPDGRSANEHLRERSRKGAVQSYGALSPEINARLDHELSVIEARGYAPLFLIMSEILGYARAEGVPTASRGSASSSLVAHCLGITTPDPIALNLYFERFLNPARTSAPDIDTDLCSVRRDKVLRHVYEHYGEDRVAMVATINRLRGRSALREAAKAHGLSQAEIRDLTGDLPYRGWGPADDETPAPYEDLAYRFPQHRQILKDAAGLLEFPRHLSVHPGGIVIAPGTLTDLAPLHLASKGLVITQFDLESVQDLGLVKIDLLGTRGLSVLGDVAEAVYGWRRTEFAAPLDVLDTIPGDDPQTSALIARAETIGCFQVESPGMRATLREVRAKTPDDILVALALYRPGPMTGGLKDAFVRRHLGEEPVSHLHSALAPLLEDTYGVILYQEQVLRIASGLAGLSLAEADLLRRAMSHFDPGERMQTLRKRFIDGALEKNDVPAETAGQIWELMAAFAGYGFPKAHAASYAQVAWHSAWCKAHFPAEFIGAVLAHWGGYYRQRVYLNEARRMGLTLHPPHIQHAGREFRVRYPNGEPELYMGFNQVRELTTRTIERIFAGRPFHSIEDFLARVDPRPDEAENLVRIGALDGLGTIPDLLGRVGRGGWQHGQRVLFETPDPAAGQDTWTLEQRLAAQKNVLGAYVDAHPLAVLDRAYADSLGAVPAAETADHRGAEITVVGIRETVQRFFHAGAARHVLELSDPSGLAQVVIDDEAYRRHARLIRERPYLVVTGVVEMDALWGVPVIRALRITGGAARLPVA